MRSTLARATLGLAALASAFASGASAPPVSPQPFEALRAADLRLATIGYRLFTANAALCRDVQPQLGWALQSLDQFDPPSRAAARAAFGFDLPVSVEAVLADGPAARAGVAADDSLAAINGAPLPTDLAARASPATRNAAEARIAALSPAAPIALTLRRNGSDWQATAQPKPGCRSALEMVLGTLTADSDGARIRIGSRFLDRLGDEDVAAIVAHELAHTILRHRDRLDAAGVSRGLFSDLGRNGRLIRETEDDADRLSVSLLYNARYDPHAAARFWRGPGAALDEGLFRARTHRAPSDRAERMDAEAAEIPPGAPRPYLPSILATRDAALR